MSVGTLIPPATLWVPERRGTYGPEVADFAADYGIPIDANQMTDVDALASYGAGGKWLTFESCLKEGRQNGKTKNTVLPITLYDLFTLKPDRICWTAQNMNTSMDVFNDVELLIYSNDELRRRVKNISRSDSAISISLLSGASLDFLARTRGGGRGLGGKRVVFDEALFMSAESMAALLPTLSARSVTGNPQVTYLSSACLLDSTQLWSLTKRGRAMNDPSLIFVERKAPGSWRAPGCADPKCPHTYGEVDGCAMDDRGNWLAGNLALGVRISYEFIAAERRSLSPTAFGIERLGWDMVPEDEDRPIRIEDWQTCDVPPDYERPTGTPRFFVDIEPGLVSASIGVGAVRMNGVPHTELARNGLGTEWLMDEVKRLAKAHPNAKWAGDAKGPILSFAPAFERAGVTLELLSVGEMAAAYGHLVSLLPTRERPEGGHTHAADPLLIMALQVARKRDIGGKQWLMHRGDRTDVSISPLVSEAGALWLCEKYPREDSILW